MVHPLPFGKGEGREGLLRLHSYGLGSMVFLEILALFIPSVGRQVIALEVVRVNVVAD